MQRKGAPGFSYDASRAPDAEAWFALPEAERLLSVMHHHTAEPRPHPLPPSIEAHAATHLAVENQLAASDPAEATRALGRLLSEGLGRHDAVHAIATLFANCVWAQSQDDGDEFDKAKYCEALDALDVKKWRELTGDDGYQARDTSKKKSKGKPKKRRKR